MGKSSGEAAAFSPPYKNLHRIILGEPSGKAEADRKGGICLLAKENNYISISCVLSFESDHIRNKVFIKTSNSTISNNERSPTGSKTIKQTTPQKPPQTPPTHLIIKNITLFNFINFL